MKGKDTTKKKGGSVLAFPDYPQVRKRNNSPKSKKKQQEVGGQQRQGKKRGYSDNASGSTAKVESAYSKTPIKGAPTPDCQRKKNKKRMAARCRTIKKQQL